MSVLYIELAADNIRCTVDEQSIVLPVGTRTLAAGFTSDPPLPEELTNAIGLVVDHLDDVDRELPGVISAHAVHIGGTGVDVVAAVEVGDTVALPFELSRSEAEEVFRTLATEAATDRRLNPGLPSEWVDTIVAVAAVIVAVIRGRDLELVTLVAPQ